MIEPLLSESEEYKTKVNQESGKQGRSEWNSPFFNLAAILGAFWIQLAQDICLGRRVNIGQKGTFLKNYELHWHPSL